MSIGAKDNLLLDARVGWRAVILDHAVVADNASLSLQQLPGPAHPLVDAAGSFGGFALPTGIAVDAEGNIYILDGQANVVKRFDLCTRTFEVVPCIGGAGSEPRQTLDPQGIAISSRGDLYVADTGNRRIQIFALKGLPLRAIWGPLKVIRDASGIHVERTAATKPAPTPNGECDRAPTFTDGTWQPWDLVLTCDCCAFVSDYANGLIHVFDVRSRWQKAYTGEAPDVPPLEKPMHLALDKSCNLYIIQEGKDYVTVLDADGNFKEQIQMPEQAAGNFCPISIAVDDKGNLYIGERTTRCVCVYCPGKDGHYKFAGACETFNGLSSALAFDHSGNPLLCDATKKQVVCFEPPPTFVTEGHYYSEPLDSRLYRCQWHRVLLRAAIQPGTQVQIDTFSSESSKTAEEISSLPDSRWATRQIDTMLGEGEWDCLITSPPGRYLWLRLTLTGDGTATPSIEWVRVYFPRASSLQYLPAVYGEDAISRDFLDHFLSIFDRITGGIADQITTIARYFDPAATPANGTGPGSIDFLAWLASWLDLMLDRHWPEEKRRKLVEQAYLLYKLRGTPEGLRLHIKLYTGREPQILENFKLRRWFFVNHARLGDQTALWGKDVVRRLQLDHTSRIGLFQLIDTGDPLHDPFYNYAHQFLVFVPTRGETSDTQKQTLKRIVEMTKPAYAQAQLHLVQPRFRVGIQSFIGVDTVIGQYPDEIISGKGRLGYDAVLGPSTDEAAPPTMRVGKSTRIGSSTLID